VIPATQKAHPVVQYPKPSTTWMLARDKRHIKWLWLVMVFFRGSAENVTTFLWGKFDVYSVVKVWCLQCSESLMSTVQWKFGVYSVVKVWCLQCSESLMSTVQWKFGVYSVVKVWRLQCSEARLWSHHFDAICEKGYEHINQ